MQPYPWPMPDPVSLMQRLSFPEGQLDVVLDTDTYNEIDDQYALSYLALKTSRFCIKAVYAAPFQNERAATPAAGMARSYQEIETLLALLHRGDIPAFRGSEGYLPDEGTAVPSPAAGDLARRAMAYTPDRPLYVLAIGAITNIASALLLNPEIRDRIVVVWLGGHALTWPHNREFNLRQDVAAARVVLGCGAAVVLLPCMGVVSAFTTSGPELEHFLRGKNPLCDYLIDATEKEAVRTNPCPAWTRPIWDVTAVGCLVSRDFTSSVLLPAPIPEYDHHWAQDGTRHLCRYVYFIHRDKLFSDLFAALSGASE